MRIKNTLRMWEQRLGSLLTWIYHWFHARQRPAQPSYEEFVLKEKLEEKERDIKYLQFQLIKVRADNTELQLRRNELAALFGDVLRKTDDQLRQGLRFHVQSAEDGTAWETVTEQCCFGGCDMGICTFLQSGMRCSLRRCWMRQGISHLTTSHVQSAMPST